MHAFHTPDKTVRMSRHLLTDLGRPLGHLIFSLMALIRDPIYEYSSKGFRGQPSDPRPRQNIPWTWREGAFFEGLQRDSKDYLREYRDNGKELGNSCFGYSGCLRVFLVLGWILPIVENQTERTWKMKCTLGYPCMIPP